MSVSVVQKKSPAAAAAEYKKTDEPQPDVKEAEEQEAQEAQEEDKAEEEEEKNGAGLY